MKKTGLLVLELIIVLCVVFAKDISVIGYGKSAAEARDDAKANLSRYINGEMVSATSLSAVVASSSSSDYKFSSNTETSSAGYLLGVEFINESRIASGQYTATAIIRDSVKKIYLSKLNEDVKTVQSIGNVSDKSKLLALYDVLFEYECFSNVMVFLGYGDEIPSLQSNITSRSVFIQYQNILVQEANELERRERSITDEAEHQKLLEQIAENEREQRKLERARAEAQQQSEASSKKNLEERLRQAEMLSTNTTKRNVEGTDPYLSRYDDVLAARTVFYNACKEYNSIVSKTFDEIESEYVAERSAIEKRPYRLAELDNRGNPIEVVKQARLAELDNLLLRKELRKAELLRTIRESILSFVYEKYAYYNEAIGILCSDDYYKIPLDSSNSTIRSSYDASAYTWTVNFSIKYATYRVPAFSMTVSYKDLTGKEPVLPAFMGQPNYNAYLEFQDEVDYLNELIKNFHKYFEATLRFKVSVEKAKDGIGYANVNWTDVNVLTVLPVLDNKVMIAGAKPSYFNGMSSLLYKENER